MAKRGRKKPRLKVRRARPEDRGAILELSKHIWGGDDYLPLVWDHWLEDEEGVLLTVLHKGRPVGMSKVTLLAPGEVWLEGLRLHPDLQGQGLSSQINRVSYREAQKLNPKTIRYSTGAGNEASRRLAEHRGFWQVGRALWLWGAAKRQRPAGRVAELSDVDRVYRFALESLSLASTSGLFATGWRFRSLTRSLVKELVEKGRVLIITRRGSLKAAAMWDEAHVDKDICLGFVDGSEAHIRALAGDILATAEAAGQPDASAMLPHGPAEIVRDAGFDLEPPGRCVVYEEGARGFPDEGEGFEEHMQRVVRRSGSDVADAIVEKLVESSPRAVLPENVRDFVHRTMVPDSTRRLYNAIGPVEDLLRSFELRNAFRAAIDALVEHMGLSEEHLTTGTASVSFAYGGEQVAAFRVYRETFHLRLGPGAGPWYDPSDPPALTSIEPVASTKDRRSGRFAEVKLAYTKGDDRDALVALVADMAAAFEAHVRSS
ncbi:MAG: GNAT family N-acetyltransferase [Candidatus Eisenbacteria bacterium]|nr:GNAT family N-acetyltransferase [Candidatus Eisenbacteria bacterium]